MSKRRLEGITQAYWHVSSSLRAPDSQTMSCEQALALLNEGDRLRIEEWRLRELIHTARFDIIENSTSWRNPQKSVGTILSLDRE